MKLDKEGYRKFDKVQCLIDELAQMATVQEDDFELGILAAIMDLLSGIEERLEEVN